VSIKTIPASEYITAFTGGVPDWIWRLKDIPPGKTAKCYVCSPLTSGWRYYRLNKEVALSVEYPTEYEGDIGYAFGHGPGKVDAEGQPLEDRARPTKIMLVRLWHVEEGQMVAAIIDSNPILKRLSRIFSNPDFAMILHENNGPDCLVSNFYLEFFHDKNPAQKGMTYQVDGHLRPTQNPVVIEEAAKPWYPDNYWQGLNPFEAPAEPPPRAGIVRKPAPVYDENGAETPSAARIQGDEVPW
jgi:hypothetical protein